ncbi:MAG: terpene cyclase/mutase family protein [Planctomycetes bacterium]|nr:terpene cyclase/mutase family protein [Planctomycetota bacterium]
MYRRHLATLLLTFSFLVPTALAQAAPPPLPGLPAPANGTMMVHGNYLYVLRGDVLYQFDAESLSLLHSFDFNREGRRPRAQPRRQPGLVIEPPAQAEEPVPTETVVEEPATLEPKAVEEAVNKSLQWLIKHQDEDGRFDSDQFMKHDTTGQASDGPGNPVHDVGATGLAVLAMLGTGSTMRSGNYKFQISKAVSWLREQQQANGMIGVNASHDFIYDHAIATWAICEAYGLSQYKLLKPVAQNALNYLESHRNPYAVWRYQPRDNDNDTSVTTWAAMALCSGRSFGLQVNPNAVQMIGNWYDQVTDDKGRSGYTKVGERSSRKPGDHSARFPVERGEALTAAALLGRFMIGQEPASKAVMAKSAGLLLAQPPQWQKDRIDAYYWFFGSFAMYQMGGEFWEGWAPHLAGLLTHQRQDGNFAGSWDPVGVWDEDGGRIYATALYSLALQTAQRKAKLVRAPQMIR